MENGQKYRSSAKVSLASGLWAHGTLPCFPSRKVEIMTAAIFTPVNIRTLINNMYVVFYEAQSVTVLGCEGLCLHALRNWTVVSVT